MPSEQATLISTFSWIAFTPSRTWSIRRASGPRTAATMQNSVAPVAAVSRRPRRAPGCRAAPPARASRTPDWRAEVAVLGAAAGLDRDDTLDLDLRPAVAHADLVGELQRVVDELVRQLEDFEGLRLVEADAPLEDLLTGDVEDHAGISMVVNFPRGMRPSRGASFARSWRLHSAAKSGSWGQEPITMPRQLSPRCFIASSVSAVWLRVPRPGAGDHDQRRAQEARDVGDRAAGVVEVHEQAAGALDDDQLVMGGPRRSRRRPGASAHSARRAAVAGASGSGKRASV